MTWKHFEYTRNLQKALSELSTALRSDEQVYSFLVTCSTLPVFFLLPAKLRIIYMPHQRANLSFMRYQLTRMLSKKSIVAGILRKRLVCYNIKPHHFYDGFGQITQTITIHTFFSYQIWASWKIYFPAMSRPPFPWAKTLGFRSQTQMLKWLNFQ